jgi:uncharacterized membrane protein
MLAPQIFSALLFYIVFSLFAAIGLPLTRRLFSNRTLAYIAAKPAGLVVFGYLVWLLASLRILDYQNSAMVTGLFALVVLGGIFMARRFFKGIAGTERAKKFTLPFWGKILIIEGVTVVIYVAYLWLRSHGAAINGTERFMDMAMLSAAGKTQFFPFVDPWYAGKTVNYYYYGSYLMSLLSNLARIPYALSYNFSLGLIYCQSVILAAALAWAMTASKKIAILAAFLVTTAGTLFFAGCTIGGLSATPQQICTYPSSTRLYTPSYIINEIPSYSFTVGDLHAHLLALPFFLFDLIILYELSRAKKPKLWLLLLLAVSLATSGMINLWDFVTVVAILGVLTLVKSFFALNDKEEQRRVRWKIVGFWLACAVGVILLAALFMLPSILNFKSPVMGLGFIPSFVAANSLKDVQWPTPPLALLGMWGVFIAGIVAVLIAKRKEFLEHPFLIAIGIVAIGILVGVELLFVRDIYSVASRPYFRANTTFKFGYHAWVLLSLLFAVLMQALYTRKPDKKIWQRFCASGTAIVLVVLVVGGGLFYPYQAIKQFYFPDGGQTTTTLDGSQWMKDANLGDLETVNYINANFHDRVVLAEAVGDSYTTYSRITTFTGMITPMGWQTHEWTWRFDGSAAVNAMSGQALETGWGPVSTVGLNMRQLYETENVDTARQIIKQYGIRYVYVGALERIKYPALQEQKFLELGRVVFESEDSKLFAIAGNE